MADYKRPNSGDRKVINMRGGRLATNNYDEEELRDSLNLHKRKVRRRILIGVVLVIVVLLAAWLFFENRTYSSLIVRSSVSREDTASADYTAYRDGFIRYSNDGVTYFDRNGKAVWNQSYSMQKPQYKARGDYFAIADIGGTTIRVFNQNGMVGEYATGKQISQIDIAKQGVVAASLSEGESNYINLYKTDGDVIVTVKTALSGDGYPLDIALSEDGKKLVVSFIYISGENMKENVVFYNFSDVGQNESERIVGGFKDFDTNLVGDVEFINNTTVVAVSENALTYYHIDEYPKQTKRITLDSEVERTFFDSGYVGLVLKNTNSDDAYRIQVYGSGGGRVLNTTTNTAYDRFVLDGRSVVMYNSSSFAVLNFQGRFITKQSSELPLTALIPTGLRGRYMLINSKYIQKVYLK